ncbi:calcium-dependent protein kinase 21 [Striga asiatica]|uniref:Calcium-dependent protein kinase 21 n=1 Tax=Striga asiatica TaxID=4170 RepID=A0A5A7PUY8_STRAF|nr:calcium-dependent protein kinase 21 [Striga asiatica]
MLIKPDLTGASPSLTLPPATACGNCGVEERRLLHHVRHRGIFRRLCTTCVLRLHPQSFCPVCYQVYPPAPPLDAVATCFKCYSSSHSQCVRPAGGPPHTTPYVCLLCLHPNTPIFKLKSAKEANICEPSDVDLDGCRVMDRDAAKKLLAAAKIASMSMNKAVTSAKAEAERRAKEAAYTRKRAKEALDYVAHLVMKEKLRKKETVLAGPSGGSSGYVVRMDRENRNVGVSASYSNGNSCSGLSQTVVLDGNADRVDNSGHILAALNAVGLKENDKIRGGISGNNGEHVNFMNLEGGLGSVDGQGEQIEDVNDDNDGLVQFVEDQMQHEEENNHGGEHHMNGEDL